MGGLRGARRACCRPRSSAASASRACSSSCRTSSARSSSTSWPRSPRSSALVVLFKVWKPKDNFVLRRRASPPSARRRSSTASAHAARLVAVPAAGRRSCCSGATAPSKRAARDAPTSCSTGRVCTTRSQRMAPMVPQPRAVRRDLHVQLARGRRHGLRARDDGRGARAARVAVGTYVGILRPRAASSSRSRCSPSPACSASRS